MELGHCLAEALLRPKKLEMPDDSTAHKKIVLAGFSGVHVQLGRAGEEIPHFSAYAENAPHFCVDASTDLEHSANGSRSCRDWFRRTPGWNFP